MTTPWFEKRKDVFLRNLVKGFFEAKVFFDEILKDFRQSSCIPYSTMDNWLGSERKKGSLWQLKDLSHRLFRNSGELSTPYENLFDWSLGSIFHEAIKLKEDSYKIDSYKPLLEKYLKNQKGNDNFSSIIYEHFTLIEDTNRNIESEIKNIDSLFSKALHYLYLLFPLKKENLMLLRFIVDNRKSFETFFGNGSFKSLIKEMFPDDITKPYLLISEYCFKGGWGDEAEKYLKEASKIDKQNREKKGGVND